MEGNNSIPVGWHLKQVVEFASKMKSGGTPKSDNLEYYNGEIPFAAIDDLSKSNKYISKTQKKITNKGLLNSSAWLVPKYSLLYSIYATLGVPRINLIEVATNQAILNIIPNKKIISLEFLYYILLEKRNTILSHSAHTTQSNLNAKVVKGLEFVFPKSTIEQNKIAEILSKVDNAISETEKIIAKYNRIKTGLMQDLFTKGIDEKGNIRREEIHEFTDSSLGRIPKKWSLKPLGKIAEFRSGYAFKFDQLTEYGYKVIRISNLHKPDFSYWHYDGPIKENWIARNGDILFTWAGVASSIDCIKYEGENALLNQHIYNFVFKNDTIKQFTYRYLQSFLPKLRLEIEGGAGQLHLTKDKIQAIDIPIMDESEMKLINEQFLKIENLINKSSIELTKLKSTKKGLMQDLLSGKKRITHLIN